jgi:hypothetical protein
MRINPCHGCPLGKDCDLRAGWRKRAAGSGFRSVSFECEKLSAEMRIGRNIEIETPIFLGCNGYYEYRFGSRSVRATSIGTATGHWFTCVIEPNQLSADDVFPGTSHNKIRFRKKLRHTRIKRFLLGPDAEIGECGHIQRDGKCDTPPGEGCSVHELMEFV